MKKFRVTVEGQTYEVEVEELDGEGEVAPSAPEPKPSQPKSKPKSAPKSQPKSQPQEQQQDDGGGGGNITAPIAGNVLDVKVSPGDEVSKGQVVMILEAMKMENEITADAAGTVKTVKAQKDDTVNSGDTLVVLE